MISKVASARERLLLAGTVSAYRKGTTVYAVHRVLGPLPPGAAEERRPLCALALETF